MTDRETALAAESIALRTELDYMIEAMTAMGTDDEDIRRLRRYVSARPQYIQQVEAVLKAAYDLGRVEAEIQRLSNVINAPPATRDEAARKAAQEAIDPLFEEYHHCAGLVAGTAIRAMEDPGE